jgi:hypothetical protein
MVTDMSLAWEEVRQLRVGKREDSRVGLGRRSVELGLWRSTLGAKAIIPLRGFQPGGVDTAEISSHYTNVRILCV